MDYDYSMFLVFACGVAFVALTRAHVASLVLRSSADRAELPAEANNKAQRAETIALGTAEPAKLHALPAVAVSRVLLPPSEPSDSSHAA